MNQINIEFVDLPNEILIIILKKLDNVDVLYSLYGINKRLNSITEDNTFTNTLKLVSTSSTDNFCSIPDRMLNRFYTSILPKIDHNIKTLVLESSSMENILHAANYPNLSEIKIFNFNKSIVSRYFRDESLFRRIFKEQITTLILVIDEGIEQIRMPDYTKNVYAHILIFFEHLKYLSIVNSTMDGCPPLSLNDCPSTTFYSSTLTKLCIEVNNFEDCLCLLDGRLKQLNTFIVQIHDIDNHSSIMHNIDDLPILKCFSLTCFDVTYEYGDQILPLLRRLSYLEELTLNLWIGDRPEFIDGTHFYNEILVHMPRLHKVVFYIGNYTDINDSIPCLSKDDLQQTFTKIGYKQVACIVDYVFPDQALCHVFSLPFAFDRLENISNNFPSMEFNQVTDLSVYDCIPFEHEFFRRIAQSFPSLRKFHVMNSKPQSSNLAQSQTDNDQSYSVVKYSNLTSLSIVYAHIDYLQQFLLHTKTSLPKLTELEVQYEKLKTVTNNFTRDATRLNCAQVKRIILEETIIYSKEFHLYFPLL